MLAGAPKFPQSKALCRNMKAIFKSTVLITLATYVILFCTPQFWADWYDRPIFDALSWTGYGSEIDINGPIPYFLLASYAVICIGLVNFKKWARAGFVIFILVTIMISPFVGLSVNYGIESIIAYILVLGQGGILSMLYLTNLSNEFDATA